MKTSKWMGLLGLGLVASSFTGGCGSTSGGSSNCTELCAKFEQCDSETDESECVEDCEEQTGFSPAYVAVNDACVKDLSCDELEDGEYGECLEEGRRDLEPSGAVVSLCNDAVAFAEECDDETDENEVRDDCEENLAIFSDALVTDLRPCLEETCDDYADCVADVVQDYGLGDDTDDATDSEG